MRERALIRVAVIPDDLRQFHLAGRVLVWSLRHWVFSERNADALNEACDRFAQLGRRIGDLAQDDTQCAVTLSIGDTREPIANDATVGR